MTTELRALDAECAELLGWTWNDVTAFSPTGVAIYAGVGRTDPWWWVPEYSSDMNFAMELWDTFNDEEWFLFSLDGYWVFEHYANETQVYAPTPAEAIARAFVGFFKKEKTG